MSPFFHRIARLGVLSLAGFAAACAQVPVGAQYSDPYEARNRKVHRFNVAMDTFLFGNKEKDGIVPTFPRPIAKGFVNFAENLSAPNDVVNRVLQGRPGKAIETTVRFLVNTTVGIGGLFDPATAMGMEKDETDFGETLTVWGSGEGSYVELPFFGPSTARDTLGMVVDLATDPVTLLLPRPESTYALGAWVVSAAPERQANEAFVEDVLYGSADSYAQARLIYLQNRRYELGEEVEVFDPYEDPYADPYGQ